MTDTPDEEELRMVDDMDDYDPKLQSRQQDFFAGKDDILAQEIVEGVNASSHTHLSKDERIKRWEAVRHRAENEGISVREAYNADLLERIKEAKGPNPTQEKARKLYEWWLSGCGTYPPGNYKRYESLDELQKQRWAMLSKALGGLWIDDKLCHDLSAETVTRLQGAEQKYKNIPAGFSWAEYDDVRQGKVLKERKLRRYRWQVWRPTEEDLQKELYHLHP